MELPRSDLLAFHSAEGARLTVRPSGTEPKVKFYLELVGHADRPAEVAPERARLEARGRAVKQALLEHLGLTDCAT
jgi:phosphomannomutase